MGDRTGKKKKKRVCHAAGGSDENGSGRLVETSRVDRGTPPRCSHEVQVCKIRVIWIRGKIICEKRREKKKKKKKK